MWQDLVFLVGSMTSVAFLYPTLRDKASRVPRATSVPSMIIGGVYAFTFFTLGMTFSAIGSFAACTMWSLIAAFRGPDDESLLREIPRSSLPERRTSPIRRIRNVLGSEDRPRDNDDDADVSPHSD